MVGWIKAHPWRWALIVLAVAFVLFLLLFGPFLGGGGGEGGTSFEQLDGLMTKPEVHSVVGPPDSVEVLKRAECWFYGPQDGITEAKLCFGERGRLAWWSWGETGPPEGPG